MPKSGWIGALLPLLAFSIHLRDRRSHSYVRTDGGLEEMRFDFDTGITVSNGGLNAPLTDMTRYLGFLIGDPARPEYEGVLRRSSLEEMWKPVIRAADGEGGRGSDVQRRPSRAPGPG
jgi:CubicO group peptidase (beta-lactamase class C family)